MINYIQDFSRKKIIFAIIGYVFPIIFFSVLNQIYGDPDSKKEISIIPECWCWIDDIEKSKTFIKVAYAFYWILIAAISI
jgi:hypothetical protein